MVEAGRSWVLENQPDSGVQSYKSDCQTAALGALNSTIMDEAGYIDKLDITPILFIPDSSP